MPHQEFGPDADDQPLQRDARKCDGCKPGEGYPMQLRTAKGESMIEAVADNRTDNGAEQGAQPGWKAKQFNEYDEDEVVRRRRNRAGGAVTYKVPRLQFAMQGERCEVQFVDLSGTDSRRRQQRPDSGSGRVKRPSTRREEDVKKYSAAREKYDEASASVEALLVPDLPSQMFGDPVDD